MRQRGGWTTSASATSSGLTATSATWTCAGSPSRPSGPAIAAAMELVAGTYALILDLRQNHGGSPEGVVFWCSYLLDEQPDPPQRHLPRRHRRDQAVLGAAVRAGDPLHRPPGLRADQPPHVLRRRGLRLHLAGSGPGRADRRDDRRRRPPDPRVPDQRGGAHRHPVRPVGQPGHRDELAGHRRGAGCRRARSAGLRRRLRQGPQARAGLDDVPPPIADEARDALAALPTDGLPSRGLLSRGRLSRPASRGRPSRGDLLAVRVDRAAGGDRAGAAAGVHPRLEDRPGHAAADGLHQVLGPARFRILGQRALPLYLGAQVTPAALPTWTSSAPPGSARPNRSNAPSSTANW